MVLTTNKVLHYQRWLKEKHKEIESLYYQHMDDLAQKLGDLELPGLSRDKVPVFVLTTYSFVDQWTEGRLSSAEVADIFERMMEQDEYRGAARAKIIKPLQKFMMDNDELAGFCKYTIVCLETDVVPLMIKYLTMMGKAFKHFAKIDEAQMPVTWVEQSFDNGEVYIHTEELSLNQAIKQLNAFIARVTDNTFHIAEQVVVFDQIDSSESRTIHWIFAPPTYIELLKSIYDIKTELKGQDEEQYLKTLLEEVC